MGYQTGRASIIKVQDKLKILLLASSDIEFPTDDNTLLAYQLREAIFAAKYHDDLKEIAKLSGKYKIVKKPGKVVMKLRFSLDNELSRISFDNIKTLNEVITSVIKNDTSGDIYYNNILLTQEELVKLYNWLFIKGLFLIVGEGQLTISRTDPGELKWKPETLL